MPVPVKTLQQRREQLKAGLAQVNDLRRGSLTARFRKCGKPNCHCAEKDSPGHGPCYSLTSCPWEKNDYPSHPLRTRGRSDSGANRRISAVSQAGARTDRR